MKRTLLGMGLGLAIGWSLLGTTGTAHAFDEPSTQWTGLHDLAIGVGIVVYGGGGALALTTAGFIAADIGLAIDGSPLPQSAAIAQVVVGAIDLIVGGIVALATSSNRDPLPVVLGLIGAAAGVWLIGHGAFALTTGPQI